MIQNSQQEKNLQNSILSSFLQGNPLSFTLCNFYERSDRNVLYINDDPGNLRFNLEIKNLLDETIFLDPKKLVKKDQGSEDNSPNENNFHIKLTFKEGELSPKSLEAIDLSEYSKEDWSISRPQHNRRDHTVSIFLLKRSEELSIEGKKSAIITLVGIGANPIAGARATQLNVNYQGFDLNQNEQNKVLKSDKPYERLVILTIINYSGKQSAPLVVKFAHSPKVLNNGEKQDITIQIVNTGKEAIGFNENSRFLITIDAQNYEGEPWALAKKDETSSIKSGDIEIWRRGHQDKKSKKSDDWIIEEPDTNGEDPVWTIKPNLKNDDPSGNKEGNTSIQPKKDILIKLKNFRTSLQAGIGNLSVSHYDLPGYKDETHILGVNKTCITEKDHKIGIGKFPEYDEEKKEYKDIQLDVAGRIAADNLEIKNSIVANTLEVKKQVNASLTVAETVTANQFVGVGAFLQGMIIMWSGDVDYLPDGWKLCNGEDGTPDLCDRFIVGAGGQYNPNKTGGKEKVKLTKENMPEHTHTVRDPGHSHDAAVRVHTRSFKGADADDWPLKDSGGNNYSISIDKAYTGISLENSGYKDNELTAVENRPPFFALAFIMYVGL